MRDRWTWPALSMYVAGGTEGGISSTGRTRQDPKGEWQLPVKSMARWARLEIRAAVASGVLFSAGGKVYVSYEGDLYPFLEILRGPTGDRRSYGGTAAAPGGRHGRPSLLSLRPIKAVGRLNAINSRVVTSCRHDGRTTGLVASEKARLH